MPQHKHKYEFHYGWRCKHSQTKTNKTPRNVNLMTFHLFSEGIDGKRTRACVVSVFLMGTLTFHIIRCIGIYMYVVQTLAGFILRFNLDSECCLHLYTRGFQFYAVHTGQGLRLIRWILGQVLMPR